MIIISYYINYLFAITMTLCLSPFRHSDVKEFECFECGKRFKRKDKLKEHAKRMHQPSSSNSSTVSSGFIPLPSASANKIALTSGEGVTVKGPEDISLNVINKQKRKKKVLRSNLMAAPKEAEKPKEPVKVEETIVNGSDERKESNTTAETASPMSTPGASKKHIPKVNVMIIILVIRRC